MFGLRKNIYEELLHWFLNTKRLRKINNLLYEFWMNLEAFEILENKLKFLKRSLVDISRS